MKRPPPVSGNGREYCPYYDVAKAACGIKTAGDKGTGGRPSGILAGNMEGRKGCVPVKSAYPSFLSKK